MVQTNYYYGSPGSRGFIDPALANTEIQKVTRSGLVYSVITSGEPGSLEVLYKAPGGAILFDSTNPFNTPGPPELPFFIGDLEKISVKFKT